MLGGPTVSASFAFAANFDAMKLPVAPQSTRTTAECEPTNPRSLMRTLLGGVARGPTSMAGSMAATDLLEAGLAGRSLPREILPALSSCEATEASWKEGAAAVGAERVAFDDGPGSWPESGEFSCPSSEKRFDVTIFSAGLTEKTAFRSRCP